MIRLNRLHWMMGIADAEHGRRTGPGYPGWEGWFCFGRGLGHLRAWLFKHDLVYGQPRPQNKYQPIDHGVVRLTPKGREVMKKAIDEYNRRPNGFNYPQK